MNLFSHFFGDRKSRALARRLYDHALTASRQVVLYANNGVPDTVDGRFDLLVIHVWLLIRRLNKENAQALGQGVFDAMFSEMDNSLRELGTSDTSVGKRIKDMAKVFYGRTEVYNAALDTADIQALKIALEHNLFAEAPLPKKFCTRLAQHMQGTDQSLAKQDFADIIKFGPCYPPFA